MIPTVSGKAITGEAARNRADSSTPRRHPAQRRCGAATVNAAQISTIEVRLSQSRGSPRMPVAPSARGSPNSAMTGRYGL